MSSFLWRVAGGLAALWLFRQLWPRQRLACFMMALFFVLYPGYLRWMEGFEDQPRILSSFFMALSIAMTLQAIRTTRTVPKILMWTGSILFGWAYIALVDFSFGMEFIRWLCVFLLVTRGQETLSFVKKSILATRAWGIAALSRLVFYSGGCSCFIIYARQLILAYNSATSLIPPYQPRHGGWRGFFKVPLM